MASLWRLSHAHRLEASLPIGHGWNKDASGNLVIEWNGGNIMPQDLIDVVAGQEDCHEAADTTVGDTNFVHIVDCSEEAEEDDEIDNILRQKMTTD